MEDEDCILGCFFRVGYDPALTEAQLQDLANNFRLYIWGENGISPKLKKLSHREYGQDLKLILFQFYVNLSPAELSLLKLIESYRSNEKSIGIPVIVNNENFFSKSEEERHNFLKQTVLQRLDLLTEVITKRKLDTNIVQLKSDLATVLV